MIEQTSAMLMNAATKMNELLEDMDKISFNDKDLERAKTKVATANALVNASTRLIQLQIIQDRTISARGNLTQSVHSMLTNES